MGSIKSDETVVGGIGGAPHLFAPLEKGDAQNRDKPRLFDSAESHTYRADNDGCAGSRNRRPCANYGNIFVVANSALPRWKSKKAQLDAAPPACPYFIIQG